MGRINLKERIKQAVFLLDGAMGTQLIACGTDSKHIEAVAKSLKSDD